MPSKQSKKNQMAKLKQKYHSSYFLSNVSIIFANNKEYGY